MVQPNPAKRGRPRKQPSHEPGKETGSEKGSDARRARKRETDRQSQRHHRERQRHYVKQLEETVESYKSSLSDVGDVNVAALLAEQDQLRRRCSELEATLRRIQTLAGSASGSVENSQTTPDTHISTSPGEARSTLHLPGAADNENDNSALPGLEPVFGAAPVETPTSFFPQELDDFAPISADFDSLPVQQPHLGEPRVIESVSAEADQPLDNTVNIDGYEEMLDSDDFNQCLASIIDGTEMSLDVVPTPPSIQNSLLTRLATQPVIAPEMPGALTSSRHLGFPKLSQSKGSWDKTLMSIVDEGRMQHRCGQFDITSPSLRKLLSNKCTDVVASRLFHFLCSAGPMPLHQLISIFWVQYLVLRWYVLGTLGDFMRMPEFLRPTDLETRIPHRPCIAMLVWPDIRRALIRDTESADPEQVGVALLQSMTPNWPSAAHVSSELIGSTDVLAIIERQACELSFWKVGKSFVESHPQFVGCQFG